MSTQPVNGWFVSTRDLIASLALIVTILGGTFAFFISREQTNARVEIKIEDLVSSNRDLVSEIKELNKTGTQGSQSHINSVESKVNSQETRINRIEGALFGPGGLTESNSEIKATLKTLTAMLEGKKK